MFIKTPVNFPVYGYYTVGCITSRLPCNGNYVLYCITVCYGLKVKVLLFECFSIITKSFFEIGLFYFVWLYVAMVFVVN